MGQEQSGEGMGWLGRKGGGSGHVMFLVVSGIAPSGDTAKKSSWGSRVAVEGSSTIQRNRGGVPGRPPSRETLSPPRLSIHEDAQPHTFPRVSCSPLAWQRALKASIKKTSQILLAVNLKDEISYHIL